MIVLDTSFVYALLDRGDRRHTMALSWYQKADPQGATTPLILAEIDHLAATRLGTTAQDGFRTDLARGAYLVDWWPAAVSEMVSIATEYADLGLGLADASLVALAARLQTTSIATFDERHFRTVRPRRGAAFHLVPLDEAS